jgi:hypothetical protein
VYEGGKVEKKADIPRSNEDLKNALVDQLQLLRLSCESYDRGIEVAGKLIALQLRVLLHKKNRSHALLDQLGYRSGLFASSGQVVPENALFATPLLAMRLSGNDWKILPKIHVDLATHDYRFLHFEGWWQEVVLVTMTQAKFTRMELVLHVADKDGGAHVDPGLDEDYLTLSRQGAVKDIIILDPTQGKPKGQPELACIRQIAHELLYTIYRNIPEFSEHSRPVHNDVNGEMTGGLEVSSFEVISLTDSSTD